MTKNNDHLDIDLDFLDKKDVPQPTTQKTTNGDSSSTDSSNSNRKYNWKNIWIVIGVVVFFVWVFSSASDSSTSSSSNSTYTPSSSSNDLTTGTGQTFSCSGSYLDRARQLRPDPSIGTQLNQELNTLNSRVDASKSESDQIDSMYVDNTDQSSIDSYNYRINNYNTERTSLVSDIADWKQRSDAYGNQIDAYNNYLDANCTKQ